MWRASFHVRKSLHILQILFQNFSETAMLSIKMYAWLLFLLMIIDPPSTQAKPLEDIEDNLENDVTTTLSPVQQSPDVGAVENLEVLAENVKELHESVDLTEESRDEVEELHEVQAEYPPQQSEADLYQDKLEIVTDRIDKYFDTSNITDDSYEYENYTNGQVEGDYYDYLANVPSQEILESEDPEEDDNTDSDESQEDDGLYSQNLEETQEVFGESFEEISVSEIISCAFTKFQTNPHLAITLLLFKAEQLSHC